MFERIREQMEIFECTFDMEVENDIQHQVVQAPRAALEQQFLSLVQQAAQSSKPVKVKMSREVPIYDNFDKKRIERENSVAFANNTYIKTKGENM